MQPRVRLSHIQCLWELLVRAVVRRYIGAMDQRCILTRSRSMPRCGPASATPARRWPPWEAADAAELMQLHVALMFPALGTGHAASPAPAPAPAPAPQLAPAPAPARGSNKLTNRVTQRGWWSPTPFRLSEMRKPDGSPRCPNWRRRTRWSGQSGYS